MELTHVDESGHAKMVDVGGKPDTHRVAVARGQVRVKRETLALIRQNALTKGDALGTARIAGIMAAKKTAELIPLCHPLMLTHVGIEFELAETQSEGLVEITGDHVSVLTDLAIAAEKIDAAKVEEARQRAEARLSEKLSDEEVASVNASLSRSLAQLHVKRRQHH